MAIFLPKIKSVKLSVFMNLLTQGSEQRQFQINFNSNEQGFTGQLLIDLIVILNFYVLMDQATFTFNNSRGECSDDMIIMRCHKNCCTCHTDLL